MAIPSTTQLQIKTKLGDKLATKRTNLLNDEPSSTDEFGPHQRIATLIRDEIMAANEGRSIAVIGEWGSGKSTVIKILETKLIQPDTNASKAQVFLYDAWSHQGDALRRAFLDDLLEFCKERSLIKSDKIKTLKESIWNRTELTTTTSEPLLRNHAKWLLFTLALVPLGITLFNIPSDKRDQFWTQISSWPNLIAILLIIAPVISTIFFSGIRLSSCTRVKEFFFGPDHQEESFSVLSFFVEKTQGKVERKHTKTPSDSIVEFKAVFAGILNAIQTNHSKIRIVVIVDNLDRIPASQARDFWATMQTFFNDEGGPQRAISKKYWLVVPFTTEALSFIFNDASGNGKLLTDQISKANSYIDKTFGITFNVPSPILSNWRKYLFDQLARAFPEHDKSELVAVRDLYGYVNASSAISITPRRMKLFVNGLVVLYRQRGEDITLPIISAYLMHRTDISNKNEISDGLLSQTEIRMLDSIDWRNLITALHFGVPPSEAAQLLLQEPILNALRDGDSIELRQIEKQPGFYDVLQQKVREMLNEDRNDAAAMLSRIAATIGSLVGAGDVNLHGVWDDMRKYLKNIEGWDNFQASPQQGLLEILTHTAPNTRAETKQIIIKSLSEAIIDFPESSSIWPNQSLEIVARTEKNTKTLVTNWLATVISLFEEDQETQTFEVQIPGSGRFKFKIVQMLAELETSNSIKTSITENLDAEEFNTSLLTEIANGRYSGLSKNLASLTVKIPKLNIVWEQVANAISQRISSAELQRWNIIEYDAAEFRSLIELLICIDTIVELNTVSKTLTQLSVTGQISNILFRLNGRPEVKAAALSLIMIYNPAFQRTGEVEQSASGDVIFNELTAGTTFDPDLIEDITAFISLTNLTTRLLKAAVSNPKIATIGSAILGALSKSRQKFNIEPQFIIDNKDFFRTHAGSVTAEAIVKNLDDPSAFFGLLINEAFDLTNCYLYTSILELASREAKGTFENFLKNNIQNISKSDWQKAFTSNAAPYSDLLMLCKKLREIDATFTLSTNSRDAIRDQISSGGSGKTNPTNDALSTLSLLLDLLKPNLRESLVRDVIDDMAASTEQQVPLRTIQWFGDKISGQDLQDSDKLFRRVFARLIDQPDEKGINWILRIIDEKTDFIKTVPEGIVAEFEIRLRLAINRGTSLPIPVREGLEKIATLFSVNLANTDQDIPSSETT
jgi:hypothetical protein